MVLLLNRRITLSDVALKAGVSRATASAVLSGKAGKGIRVSEDRMKDVIAAANSLGYVPNTAAQHLKKGDDNHIIALFTYENIFPSDYGSEYYHFFLGIQQEAEREDYDVLILNNWARDKSRSSRIRLASGAIMIGVNRDDSDIRALIRQDFPLVFVGRRDIGESLPIHFVTFAYKEAVTEIIELVSAKANGSISYVSSCFSSAEPSADKSYYLHESAEKRGIEVVDIVVSDSLSDDDIRTVLSSSVVIFDRLFIADLFKSAFMARGIVPGRDIFGAILEDDWMNTHSEWTRWENRRSELGALSVRYLVSLLSGKEMIPEEIKIPIIESQSTLGV